MRFIFTCATDLRHGLDLDLRGADAGEHCTRATADLLLNADRSSRDLQFFSRALTLSAASCPCCRSNTCVFRLRLVRVDVCEVNAVHGGDHHDAAAAVLEHRVARAAVRAHFHPGHHQKFVLMMGIG